MNTIALWITHAAVSASVATAVLLLAPPHTAPDVAQPNPPADSRVDELLRRIDELQQRVQAPPPLQATRSAATVAELSDERLMAMVRRVLADTPDAGRDRDTLEVAPTAEPDRVAAFLLAKGIHSPEARAMWQALEKDDRLAEVLAVFERQAAAMPNSTDAQCQLARAYNAAGQVRPNHPNGDWWRASDDAYTRALELDPQHAEARYEKAVALSFWPAGFGRLPEAIEHLEILVDQYESAPPQADQARSYVWLGNLLAQRGDAEDAADVWRRGLSRHPNDEALRQKINR